MKYSFLFHLLSFLPIHTPPPIAQHILISEIQLPDKTEIELLTKKKKIDTWIHFQSHKHGWNKNEVNVYLPDFFHENKNIPNHLKSSLYHYHLYSSHRFSNHISYQEYCLLEKQLSDVVSKYVQDDKQSYGIIMDEALLEPSGITKYWQFEKNYITILKQKYFENYPDFVILDRINDIGFL